MGRSVEQKWNLLGAGQDTYAGANAQDPRTSRKVQSWIVQDDGQLHRELPEPAYAANTLPGPVAGLYEFDQNNGQGAVNRFYFCAARTNSTVGTQSCLFYQMVAGSWTQVAAVGTLANAPMCVTQENNFFLDDGVSNWLFNGTIWVQNGINFPLTPPALNTSSGSSQVFLGSAGVTLNFFNTGAPYKGGVSLVYAGGAGKVWSNSVLLSPVATVTSTTTASLIFNPLSSQYLAVGPINWATLDPTSGAINGYVQPYSGAVVNYEMTLTTNIVIPVAGAYTISFIHGDGAFFGFGAGLSSGAAPALSTGKASDAFETQTAWSGYPVMAGISMKANTATPWQESFQVTFTEADTYPLEIDFTNWENGQTLQFTIIETTLKGGGAAPSTNPYYSAGSNPGSINATLGRYYWTDNADQTVGVATESSTSPISPISGPLTGGSVQLYQQPGLFTCSTASTTVTGSNSSWNIGPNSPDLNGSMVGQVLYLNGTQVGTVANVGAGQTIALSAVSAPKQITLANGSVIYEATYSYVYSNPAAPTPPGANNALANTIWTITGFVNTANNLSNAVAISSTANTIVFQNANSVLETHTASMTSPASKLQLASNATASVANGTAVICDARCTHWNVYGSESDGSKIGQYLFSVPVTQNLTSSPYVDTSPFLDSPSNTFLPVFRPVRNDRPVPSKLLTIHKVRQFRRVESSPNFFAFTANEEVTAGNNGDPAQCLPGSNVATVSDMVNEVSFPDQSARLRALISHMDALYMFSEKQCYPLYGQSVDDFAISQMITFALGAAGRFAGQSTPNGLAFMSYDKRAFLYPTSLYSTYLAQGGAGQSALTEIGKPMRNVFAQIPSSRLDEVVSMHYHYGVRDWWVVSFPTSAVSDVPQTWVWDFMGKSWFQLQRGFASLQVFEVSEGALVLIGGGVDGNTYVVDDQTGTYSSGANLPAATWQPALVNFGNEEVAHKILRLELEFSSDALAKDISITCWPDPINVDSPGVGRAMHLRPILGACRYAAFFTDQGGALCQRALFQIQAKASTNAGTIRGIKLYADTAPGFITGSGRAGGV